MNLLDRRRGVVSSKPELTDLKLPQCCAECLKDIDTRIQLGRVLQAVLVASPFVMMLEGPLAAALTIKTTEWDLLTKAVKGVPAIARRRAYDLAALHSLDHPGGDLNRFWVAMAESFL
jgi:hypothetical protein